MARIVLLLASAALCHAGEPLNLLKRSDSHPGKQNFKDQVDLWKNCGEPVAYWGEGNDRTQCPCKPDPSKTAIKDSLPARLELLSKSPEHKWKVNASKRVHFSGQFYINLEKSTKRRDFIENQLTNIHNKHREFKVRTNRWAGTDPHQAARANLKEFSDMGLDKYVKDMGDREKWGTIGTYVSHLRLLRRIWSNDKDGEGLYIIMEDDGTLDPDFHLKVKRAFDNEDIPKDWDMIKFGFWGLTRCEDQVSGGAYEGRTPMMLNDGTRKSYYNGNLGYIVRPKSIPAILAAIRKKPVFDVDGVFISLNEENPTAENYGIRTYFMKHSLVKGGTGGEGLATERLGGQSSMYSLQQQTE